MFAMETSLAAEGVPAPESVDCSPLEVSEPVWLLVSKLVREGVAPEGVPSSEETVPVTPEPALLIDPRESWLLDVSSPNWELVPETAALEEIIVSLASLVPTSEPSEPCESVSTDALEPDSAVNVAVPPAAEARLSLASSSVVAEPREAATCVAEAPLERTPGVLVAAPSPGVRDSVWPEPPAWLPVLPPELEAFEIASESGDEVVFASALGDLV